MIIESAYGVGWYCIAVEDGKIYLRVGKRSLYEIKDKCFTHERFGFFLRKESFLLILLTKYYLTYKYRI